MLCCFNPALLDLPNPVGLDAYMEAKHAVISQTDSLHGCIKDALELTGVEIDVVAAAPDFLSVLATARSSAVLATVSSRIALRYAPMLGLEISPVPVALKFRPSPWSGHCRPMRMPEPCGFASKSATLWAGPLIVAYPGSRPRSVSRAM